MSTLPRPHRRHTLLTALLLVLGLVLAACADDGVPQADVDAMLDQVSVATERLDDLALQLTEVQQDADGEVVDLAEAVQQEIAEVTALLEDALAGVVTEPVATSDPVTEPAPPPTP